MKKGPRQEETPLRGMLQNCHAKQKGRPVLPGRLLSFLMVGRPRRRLQQACGHIPISAGASGARAFTRGVIQIVGDKLQLIAQRVL